MCTLRFHFSFFISNAGLGCGIRREPTAGKRIVGGEFADPGEWPWQVLLQWENGTKSFTKWHNKSFCGGTI